MGTNINDALDSLVGKRCGFETRDGTIRTETVTSVKNQPIMLDGGVTAKYPVTIHFGHGEIDGVEVVSLKAIKVLPE